MWPSGARSCVWQFSQAYNIKMSCDSITITMSCSQFQRGIRRKGSVQELRGVLRQDRARAPLHAVARWPTPADDTPLIRLSLTTTPCRSHCCRYKESTTSYDESADRDASGECRDLPRPAMYSAENWDAKYEYEGGLEMLCYVMLEPCMFFTHPLYLAS